MASKVQVAQFYDFNEGPILDSGNSSRVWNMEENDVLGQLKDESFKKRVEILEQLIITVRRNNGRLPYTDHESIFRGLSLALADSNYEIRLKCINLLQELIPSLNEDLDRCMSFVINKLIPNIGDSKVTVRKAVVSNLHQYMKYTHNLPNLLHAIVNVGLENEDSRVRRETINALPMLLTKDFVSENFYGIIQSLAKKLLDTSVEDNLKDISLSTLQSIETLVGENQFDVYLQKLSPHLCKYYLQLTGRRDNGQFGNFSSQDQFFSSRASGGHVGMDKRDLYMDSLEYGIISSNIMMRINDQNDFKTRAQAVEDLKGVVLSLNSSDINQKLVPHILPFLSFLSTLLDDSNFKIITVTLEILYTVVERLAGNVKPHIRNIISVLSKRMGDNKVVIRQSVMKVVIKMMQCYSAQAVLSSIFENLTHRNSRVRQETINIIIAALLTFPSYEFDLPNICHVVGPTLTDVKRQVRLAALECFAMLAQAMGSGRLQPLVQAVDQVELSTEGEGLMAAVQARLARRQLPRLNSEGLVEYATPIPSSATQRSPVVSQSADTEWILAVGGGSARTARSDTGELDYMISSSARTTPGISESNSQTPAPRRFMSAGRGRNKLPWEEARDERSKAYEDLPSSAPSQGMAEETVPVKPRNTWVEENNVTSDTRHQTKRRTITMAGLGIMEDDHDHAGSYQQIYHQRQRRQPGPKTNSFGAGAELPDYISRDTKDNGFNKADQRTPRTFLDPIPVDPIKAAEDSNKPDGDTPIALKASIARGPPSHKNTAKVPPISTERVASIPDDDSDSAYSISTNGGALSQNGSLRGIRNSASKKKAERLFERIEKQNSRQSMGSPTEMDKMEESGIFSTTGTLNSNKSRKSELQSESKPKLTRSVPAHKRNPDNLDINENKNTIRLDYNPVSGVTFRENRNSDVEIVGRGYTDDTSVYDNRTSQQSSVRPRERRKFNNMKGSVLSPLGATAQHINPAPLGVPETDRGEEEKPKSSIQGKIALVGKGMFETSASTAEYSTSAVALTEKGELRRPEQPKTVAPSGVIGIAVKSTADVSSTDSDSTMDGEEDSDTDDDAASLSKSISLKHSIALKVQKKQEEAEKQQREKEQEYERKQKEKEDMIRQERVRQQQKLKKLGSSENLSIEPVRSVSGSSTGNSIASNYSGIKSSPPKPTPPAITARKTIKTTNEPISVQPMPATVDRSYGDADIPAEEWKPFTDPEGALRAAQKKLESDDWELKVEGLNMVRGLSHFHRDLFSNPQTLHPVIVAVVNEVKNLRSQVSRLAIMTLGDMFVNLKRSMDPDLDIVTRQLLAKAGESNNFIRDDVDQALTNMVEGVTSQRAVLALINGGATHKNSAVRRTTAQFLAQLVENMGSGRVLSGVKDVTDRILPTVAQFNRDSSQETRFSGRKILWQLMSHPDFDRMLAKYLPQNALRDIQEVVENLRNKGLGDKPNETSSARSRRSGHGSRLGSSLRGGSANSLLGDSLSSTMPSMPRRRQNVRTDEATMDEIKTMITQMSANDWRQRYEGIEAFQEMCIRSPNVVAVHIVKIGDKFFPRLQDSNSKVNLHALKVMHQLVPLLKDALHSVISMAVSSLVPNLSSKNRDIYTTATEILESFLEHLDHGVLVQPFASQAQLATGRSKSEMVEKVSYLVDRVYPKKPKQVILHVLPLLWHLLGLASGAGSGTGGDLKAATAQLAKALYGHMGQSLQEKANSDPNVTARHLTVLNELL